jgi:Phospholipase_D-nuclease N-terminal
MVIAAHPLLHAIWTMCILFLWILWLYLLFKVLSDLFRRHDISGWGKVGWIVFTIVLPYLGVFVYVATQNDGMQQRSGSRTEARTLAFEEKERRTLAEGGPAAEIHRAKTLLDAGVITHAEFDELKAKALAH